MSLATQLFRYLEGSWTFERLITGSQAATARGSASFTKEKATSLFYKEMGHLKELGTDFHQEYVYCLESDRISVYFCRDACQGKLFNIIELHEDLDKIRGASEHLCPPDLYELTYTFPCDEKYPCFTIFCRVIGPKKDYTIETNFRRTEVEKKESTLA